MAYDRELSRHQAIINRSPTAKQYYSDDATTYTNLVFYPGKHQAFPDKRETYSVEGNNAELRHYLARLVRRSRCFTRSIPALRAAVKLFVFAWNRRQLFKRAHPTYPANLADFVLPRP